MPGICLPTIPRVVYAGYMPPYHPTTLGTPASQHPASRTSLHGTAGHGPVGGPVTASWAQVRETAWVRDTSCARSARSVTLPMSSARRAFRLSGAGINNDRIAQGGFKAQGALKQQRAQGPAHS